MLLVLMVLVARAACGQYPLTRTIAVRDGQQGVQVSCMAQDSLGLLWLGGPRGLFRTDGDRTDAALRTDNDAVTAVCGTDSGVLAALASGTMIRCEGLHCDTLWTDTTLRSTPVRTLALAPDHGIWVGTHGGGAMLRLRGETYRLGAANGLSSDHVNALCLAGSDRMAIATDHGIVLMDLEGRRIAELGEDQGAPDNLVLDVCRDPDGRVWAGTDRGGVFSFSSDGAVSVMEKIPAPGTVHQLAATIGRVWMGVEGQGLLVRDRTDGQTWYTTSDPEEGSRVRMTDLLRDRDGAVWWCDGGAVLRRADPYVLVHTSHEGHDLRHVSAVATIQGDRMAFAVRNTVLLRSAKIDEGQCMRTVVVPIDTATTITSLHADVRRNLWAGTFGQGLFRLDTSGRVYRCEYGPDPMNSHVMALRTSGDTLWAATLDGVFRIVEHAEGGQCRKVPIPGSGFTYDVLPRNDGSVLVATDGYGVIRILRDGSAQRMPGARDADRTFHTLCTDVRGDTWACGPSTGLYRVDGDLLTPFVTGPDLAMNEVFAFAGFGKELFLFGDGGAFLIDPRDGRTQDITNAIGLRGAQAELNDAVTDDHGALWTATDRGLYRLSPGMLTASGRARAVITSVRQGVDELPTGIHAMIAAGDDHISFRFTGIHYSAPEDLRFAYRMTGIDTALRLTRDRELTFARLRPGEHRFELFAFTGRVPDLAEPVTFTFTIAHPWWQRPWAIGLGVLATALILFGVLRSRESRMRVRDRMAKAEAEMEREKARFEMRVLRSQVNPHFLFNSFNTLIGLIEESPEKAVEHTEHLSDFFREIMQVRDKDLIPLREELRLVDTYFALEQRRFGDRIALRTRVGPDALDAEVPPLAVQSLVENALKHNRATHEEPLVVEITAERGSLTVSNPFRPREETVHSTGFGVESIIQRFATITHRSVRIGRENDNFVACIPLITPGT